MDHNNIYTNEFLINFKAYWITLLYLSMYKLIFSSRLRDSQSTGLMRNSATNFHGPKSVIFTSATDHFESLTSEQIHDSNARACD